MPRSSPAPTAHPPPRPRRPTTRPAPASRLRRRSLVAAPSDRSWRPQPSWRCASAFSLFLGVGQGGGHIPFELAHPHKHDLLFLLRHAIDRERQPGARGTHLHPLRQLRSTVLGLKPETPDRGRVRGTLDV